MANSNTSTLLDIYRLVSRNQTKKAIDQLLFQAELNLENIDFYHNIVVLSNQYHYQSELIGSGVLDRQKADEARTRLLFQLLKLIHVLGEDFNSKHEHN